MEQSKGEKIMREIRKAVLPVAGAGTRFLPVTKSVPKEMLSLIDKPVIHYVVEEAVASGIEEIILVTGANKNSIKHYFETSPELESFLEEKNKTADLKVLRDIPRLCRFSYVLQEKPLGLGHAVLQAKQAVGNEPFAVMLVDDIMYSEKTPALQQLKNIYEETGSSVIALRKVPKENISDYGVAEPAWEKGNTCRINSLVEKPPVEKAPSDLAVVGRYLLTPAVFDILEKTGVDGSGEIQLTDGLNALCADEAMYGCVLEGKRYDCGTRVGFLKASVDFGLLRKDVGNEFRAYLKSLEL